MLEIPAFRSASAGMAREVDSGALALVLAGLNEWS